MFVKMSNENIDYIFKDIDLDNLLRLYTNALEATGLYEKEFALRLCEAVRKPIFSDGGKHDTQNQKMV